MTGTQPAEPHSLVGFLERLRPLTDYGRPGTRDTEQAELRRALDSAIVLARALTSTIGVRVLDEGQERAAFESWCESRGRGHSTILKFDNGDYRNETAREEWSGWLGRAAHLSGVDSVDGRKQG